MLDIASPCCAESNHGGCWISMKHQSPPAAQSGRWRTSSWWTQIISPSLLLLYRCLAEAQVIVHLLVPAHLVLPRKLLLNRKPFSIIRGPSEELPCWKTSKTETCTLACSCHLSERGCLGTTWYWRSWIVLWILFCSGFATFAYFIIIAYSQWWIKRWGPWPSSLPSTMKTILKLGS